MNVGSLFSGIGGFDRGLERAGMRISWQCESNRYCRGVLARHWPNVTCYPDVTRLAGVDVEPVDVLCGGSPCQDTSQMGKGAGLDGARSGLWTQFARLAGELRPRYLIMENVTGLLDRGFERVLGDLAALGYDAEWDCLPACAFGAPHQRDRIWLVAYPDDSGRLQHGRPGAAPADVVAAERGRPDCPYCAPDERCALCGGPVWQAALEAVLTSTVAGAELGGDAWAVEPRVGRLADGVPDRVERIRALGNSLVPQIPEWIGRRLMAWEHA